MPGATSRTTGSATRWNSLTPSFIRQGSDHPLRVTIGLKGRPVGGGPGGSVAADDWDTASGSTAAPTRLTAAAPRKAAPARKKSLRFDMRFLSVAGGRFGGSGWRRHGGAGPRRAAGQCGLEVGLGDQEVAQCQHVVGHATDLLTRIGEQLEHTDEHAVVAQQVLLGD